MDLKEQYEKLLRYCYALTKDREVSEDIVQQTYLKFWTSRSYRDTGRETSYLYVIARNLCMDEFRRPAAENIDDYSETAAASGPGPEDSVDRIAVEDALDALPESIREVVVLRYVSGAGMSEIAKITGLSRFSVRRRLNEGLDLLKKALGGDDNE